MDVICETNGCRFMFKNNNDTIGVEVWGLSTSHNGLGHVCN